MKALPKVKLFGNLRTIARTSLLEIPGESVEEVIRGLTALHPELGQAILEDGALRPHFRVMVAGRDVELAEGLKTPVMEQDEIAIFPPIAGG